MNRSGIACALVAILLGSAPAHSASLAVATFNGNGFGLGTSAFAVTGMLFRPNEDIDVLELGLFDKDGNGLQRAYTMGLMATDNTVLGSVVVPAGTAGRLDGPFDPSPQGVELGGSGFRYAALGSPVRLTTGTTYAVVALVTPATTSQDDARSLSPQFTMDPAITFVGTKLDCCNARALVFPTQFNTSEFVTNFTFTRVVPLPAGAPLLASALGVAALVRRRQGRRHTAAT